MEKPTIEEIEALLDGKEFDVVIMPNGEIKAACKNCLKLKERIVELEKSLQQGKCNRPDNAGAKCTGCTITDIKEDCPVHVPLISGG